MTCPVCKISEMNWNVEMVGGCSGDHGDGYCYCDPRSLEITLTCPSKPCDASRGLMVDDFTDHYDLERWLKNNYQPSPITLYKLNINKAKYDWRKQWSKWLPF